MSFFDYDYEYDYEHEYEYEYEYSTEHLPRRDLLFPF